MNEEKYRITPKGFFAVELKDFDNEFWDKLTDFVAEQAKENGMTEGVPCLVLSGGGFCITAVAEEQIMVYHEHFTDKFCLNIDIDELGLEIEYWLDVKHTKISSKKDMNYFQTK